VAAMSGLKSEVEGRASTTVVAAKGGNLSHLSHGLTGRCGTMAPEPDTFQDANVRIRIPAHRRARGAVLRNRRLGPGPLRVEPRGE
jgi:hypothetical protein